jgi:hypothetical protein
MATLSKVHDKAFEFIGNLLNCGLTLSQCIYDSVDLSKGSIEATSTKDISYEDNFNRGGTCSRGKSEQILAEFIYQKLKDSNLSCYFVNDSVIKGYEILEKRLNVIYHKSEVYHYILPNTALEIINTVRWHSETSISLVGIITSAFVDKTILEKQEIDLETIQSIVNKIEYLIVGAFDGECYLIWTKNR